MDLIECDASTSEYLAVHAAADPSRPAVIFNKQVVTYGLMYQHVKSFTVGLHALGVKPGDKCIIKIAHSYVHWVILLALENLAAVSASVKFNDGASLWDLFKSMDRIISQEDLPIDDESRHLRLTDPWVQAHLDQPVEETAYRSVLKFLGPQAGQRVKRSSGTTGAPKAMLARHKDEEARIKGYSEVMGFSRHSRYLVSNDFVVGSVQSCAALCLRLGAQVIFQAGADRMQLIHEHRVTHIRLFQGQVLETLEAVETQGHGKPPNLTVILGAGPVSQQLWDRILRVLATDIVYTYNANECGSICIMKPDGTGVVRAGVQVSIVDDNDRALPSGEVGRVRVKTPSMVTGYLDNEEATRRNFKEGWFYTGDAACFVGERKIRLMGRVDDVINLAGFKRSCVELEALAESIEGIQEACVTSALDHHGVTRMVIIAALAPEGNKEHVQARIVATFPAFVLEGARIFYTDKLLRSENGKLKRREMTALISPPQHR